MAELNPNEIPDRVDKAEKTFLWFLQNVIRGSWFRRCVVLFVLFLVVGAPSIVEKAFGFFAAKLPPSYTTIYWVVLGCIAVLTLLVGYFTVPKVETTAPVLPAVRGLLPFNVEDAELFAKLQRGVELQRVTASMRDPNFRIGILVGTSGSGKTSFLRAGVVPSLVGGKLTATYVELSNEPPLQSVARALKLQGQTAPCGILLLDQFEQFFLHFAAAEDRKPFTDALKEWYARDSGVRVLVSIRAEDAWQMIEIQEAVGYELTNQNHFQLPRFDVAGAVEALKVLCERANIEFDPSFAIRIVSTDLRDPDGRISPVNLGIIALVLASQKGAFTPESFKARGGVAALLEDWLDSQIQTAKLQGLDKIVVKTLAAFCDFETNRRAGALTLDALASRQDNELSPSEIRRAVDWLGLPGVRLVIPVEKEGSKSYQLSHERLIPAIRKAAGKVLDEAARASDLLERRTRTWIENECSRRYLLNFREVLQIRRQLPNLFWGRNREQKADLLRSSATRVKGRGFALVGIIGLLLIGRVVWSTNTVQRFYVNHRLTDLARSYPSESVGSALAAAGRLSEATNAILNTSTFFEDEEEYRALAEVCKQAAMTALSKKDEKLLKAASQLAERLLENSPEGINAVAIALAKAGRIEEARKLVDRPGFHDAELKGDAVSKAWQAIGVGLARNKKYEEAFSAASKAGSTDATFLVEVSVSLIKDSRMSDVLTLVRSNSTEHALASTIVTQLASSSNWNRVRELTQALKENPQAWQGANRALAEEYVKVGEFDDALKLIQLTDKDGESKFEEQILVEMAIRGRRLHDTKLMQRALKRAHELKWDVGSYEQWEIEATVGDSKGAETLFSAAWSKSIADTQQGHSIPGLSDGPLQMADLAAKISDHEMMANAFTNAIQVAGRTPSPAIPGILSTMVAHWSPKECEEFLEQMLRRQPQLKQYNSLICSYIARFGNLKRAIHLAESYGFGGKILAESFADIVLEDANEQRPADLRKNLDRMD